MAVFPDRIVLKNSTDAQAVIEAAIGSGGSDAIAQGEVVIGIEPNAAKLYTIDGSGNVVTISSTTGGGGASAIADLTDVSSYTSALATYATRGAFNTVPSTDRWSANPTQLFFPQLAGNGFNLLDELGSTNPGSIGVSTDGVTFTYYVCSTWQSLTSYFKATLTGLDAQAFYDLGDRPIWIDFGPEASPVEGATLVYEAANNYYKIKKNLIANQGDFSYQKEVATYEFTFSATDTPNPASGEATVWTTYGDAWIWLSTTDANALNAEADLYALAGSPPVTMSINGAIVFSGNLTQVANKGGGRISLQFPGVQSWITNLQAGDTVGIRSDSVFTAQPAALPITDGQVLTWVDANSQWEPATPSLRLTATAVPGAPSSTGSLGEIRQDATYLYVCTATDTWKRIAWDTW